MLIYQLIALLAVSLFGSSNATPPLRNPTGYPTGLPATPPYNIFANFNSNGIRGFITMTSNGNGVTIQSSLYYAQNIATAASTGHQWRIHTARVIKPYECATAKNMYDPTNKAASAAYQCTLGNLQACAEGDMGGKFGPLSIGTTQLMGVGSQPATGGPFLDQSFDIRDIYGGTIVIYKVGAGVNPSLDDSLACGIIEVPLDVEVTYGIKPNPKFNKLQGTVRMQQQMDGTVAITPNLQTGDAASVGHDFHVHAIGPRAFLGADCDKVGGHYDPYDQETPNGALAKDYNCNPINPRTCYSGDISGKNGALSLPIAAGQAITESYLDLYDVSGRALVVHIQNGGVTRLGCAQIPALRAADDSMMLLLTAGCAGAYLLILIVVQFVAE